jgi:hypothetical protein
MEFDENKVISLLTVSQNGTQSFAHGQLKNAAIELVKTYGADWAKPSHLNSREISIIRGQIRKILVKYGPKEHSNVSVNWRRLKNYAIAYEKEVGVLEPVPMPTLPFSKKQIQSDSSVIKFDLNGEKNQIEFTPENSTEELTLRQLFDLFFLKLKKLFNRQF